MVVAAAGATASHVVACQAISRATSRRPICDQIDAPLINEQRQQQIRKVLAKLDGRDRKLLRALFFDELGSAEVCRRFQVEPDYLRVLVFRAKGGK